MRNFIILSLIIAAIGCGNKKGTPVLVLGKHLNDDGRIPNVTGSSNFSGKDNFAWILKQSKTFNFSKINIRFYKVESNGEKLVSSDEFEVNPQHSCIYNTFPAKDLLNEYGEGKFVMQFLRGDEVLDSKTFTLSTSSENDFNNTTEEKLSVDGLANNQYVAFGEKVSLVGKLTVELFYGAPGFGETPDQDEKEWTYILRLDNPINIGEAGTEIESWKKIDKIHVIPYNSSELQNFKNEEVVITCSLDEAISGHHHAPAITDDVSNITKR